MMKQSAVRVGSGWASLRVGSGLASPRASLALLQSSRALGCIRGQEFVTPDIVQAAFLDAMRHRVGLTYEAEASEMTADQILDGVLKRTPIPEGS